MNYLFFKMPRSQSIRCLMKRNSDDFHPSKLFLLLCQRNEDVHLYPSGGTKSARYIYEINTGYIYIAKYGNKCIIVASNELAFCCWFKSDLPVYAVYNKIRSNNVNFRKVECAQLSLVRF